MDIFIEKGGTMPAIAKKIPYLRTSGYLRIFRSEDKRKTVVVDTRTGKKTRIKDGFGSTTCHDPSMFHKGVCEECMFEEKCIYENKFNYSYKRKRRRR